jgi:NAD-dependent dihydropyrimidine dehydrogenase PreA subunit
VPYKDPAKQKSAQRKFYENNKADYAGRSKNARLVLRDEINRIKEKLGCTDCRTEHPYYVLQFDHLEGSEKVAGIHELIRYSTRDAVIAEIAKCEVVCANCHATRTFKRLMQ